MARREALRHHLGIAALVDRALVEADRKGHRRRRRQLGHQRDHRARVDAARQKCAERHVGDQPQPHRLAQPLDQSLGRRVEIAAGRVVVAHVPIALDARRGIAAAPGQTMGGRQLGDRAVDGLRVRHVAVGEEILDRAVVERALEPGVDEQRLQLRAEDHLAARQLGPVERLLAQAVARQEQGLAALVPQREGEHAAEAIETSLAPLFPGVDDHLGVGMGAEAMARRGQLADQRPIVVDFAVERDDDAAVLVEQRLPAAGQVDDR